MQTEAEIRWMEEALSLAEEARKEDEVPIGAVLVSSSGDILGTGRNRREQTHRTTAHAEIVALEDFNHKFSTWRLPAEATLFVTVEPCLMCVGALLWARVHSIVYGCSDPKGAGLERLRPLIEQGIYDHKFTNIVGGVLEKECSALITTYFQQKRKSSVRLT